MPGKVFAQNGMGPGAYAIAGTTKILAKIFVQTADLDKIKTKQIKALSKMKDAKFQKRYAEIYIILKDAPTGLLSHYGLIEHMSKKRAINEIRHVDKSDLIEMIDKIPDQLIVKNVRNCLRQQADQLKDKTFLQQIEFLWKKFIQKAG